jgi:RNA polymerase sigma-70 factor (ECF subfamily)
VSDEQLRLIFACCDPALAPEEQVALALHRGCGMTIEQIAGAFFVPTTTMARRLAHARATCLGTEGELAERLSEMMLALYVLFNEGYARADRDRRDRAKEAIALARRLRARFGEPPAELDGLLALMLLHDARRAARVGDDGELVALAAQDRGRWNRDQIAEGCALVRDAVRRAPPGPYALQAAIAAVHAETPRAGDTDWPQIVALYERLLVLQPSPVVALNRAVAMSMADGPLAALPLVDALRDQLESYYLWHATRADLLRRLRRTDEAIASYRRALALAADDAERRFLARRLADLGMTSDVDSGDP